MRTSSLSLSESSFSQAWVGSPDTKTLLKRAFTSPSADVGPAVEQLAVLRPKCRDVAEGRQELPLEYVVLLVEILDLRLPALEGLSFGDLGDEEGPMAENCASQPGLPPPPALEGPIAPRAEEKEQSCAHEARPT
mmetsp:Transcript_35795/g.92450  ORF Transcript_35795/g.92450 Transcript_35795/m.92450 type:complete len:135 (+) Transcript_35795:1124-1528(+)